MHAKVNEKWLNYGRITAGIIWCILCILYIIIKKICTVLSSFIGFILMHLYDYFWKTKFAHSLWIKMGGEMEICCENFETASQSGHELCLQMLLNRARGKCFFSRISRRVAKKLARNLPQRINQALCRSILAGHHKCVDILIKSGGAVDAINMAGLTYVHHAALKGNHKILRTLIKYGADINIPALDGTTPLHLAAWNNHTQAMKLLLDRGSNVNAVNRRLQTPLHLAAYSGSADSCRVLIKFGANINASDEKLLRALHLAAEQKHSVCLESLVRNGATVNVYSESFITPLHIVTRNNMPKLVEVLIKQGADVNSQDYFGSTPLHFAASCGHDRCLEILLRNGALVELSNDLQYTAIEIASLSGQDTCYEMLVKYGANAASLHGTARRDAAVHNGVDFRQGIREMYNDGFIFVGFDDEIFQENQSVNLKDILKQKIPTKDLENNTNEFNKLKIGGKDTDHNNPSQTTNYPMFNDTSIIDSNIEEGPNEAYKMDSNGPIHALKLDPDCRVCMDNERNCVLIPCGHIHVCMHCTKKLKFCPICKEKNSQSYADLCLVLVSSKSGSTKLMDCNVKMNSG